MQEIIDKIENYVCDDFREIKRFNLKMIKECILKYEDALSVCLEKRARKLLVKDIAWRLR